MISTANFSRDWLQPPNLISLARLLAGLFLPALILSPQPGHHVLACVVFAVGAMSDHWDGYLARRLNLVSDYGKYMDPLADKVFILGPMAAFAHLDYYSMLWVVPVFFREIVITFCRTGWLIEGSAIGAETLGKYKLGFQVALISAALLYHALLPAPSWGWLAALFCAGMNVFLVLAVLMTVLSGWSFMVSNYRLNQTPFFAKFTAAVGVGLLPYAPGTWGSVAGLLIALLAQVNGWVYLLTFGFLLWAGWRASLRLDLTKEKDPSYVVMDETCGMMLALAGIPLHPASVITAFLLFRFFDIVKPYPIRRLERIPGYAGIMLDDLAAGAAAWMILRFLWGAA